MGIRLEQIKDPRVRERLERELEAGRKVQSPQPEPALCHEPLAAGEGTKEGSRRINVRVNAYRSRLLDPDNLCAKSLIDGLRYAGLIPGDRPQDIELTVTQEKCDKQDERTEIELIY